MANCYFRDGTVAPYSPCGTSTPSFCCPDAFACYSGGLCGFDHYINTSTTGYGIGSLTYGVDIIEVTRYPTCTDKNWSCDFAPDPCPEPFDEQCSPNSVGYLPLRGCDSNVESQVGLDGWLHCNCNDKTCAGAQAKYESFGPLGTIVCPAWREGKNLSTYCDNPEGGQTVSITSSTLTVSAISTSALSSSALTVSIDPSVTIFTATVFVAPSATAITFSSQDTSKHEHALSAELMPIPIVFSVAGVLFIIIFGLLFRRRQMKRRNAVREQDPPPYDEATAGDVEKGSPFKVKDKKQGHVTEYMAKIHAVTGHTSAKNDKKSFKEKGESDDDQISSAGADVYKF